MSDLSSCDDGWVILLYLFFSILVCFLAVVCEGLLVLMSLKVCLRDLCPSARPDRRTDSAGQHSGRGLEERPGALSELAHRLGRLAVLLRGGRVSDPTTYIFILC